MADYTCKDHMASTLNGKRTDRIPVRGMLDLREGLKRTRITGKEINTRPDKYVEALVATQEVISFDAVTVLVSDHLMQFEATGPNTGLTYEDIQERRKKNIPLLEDKALLTKFELTDIKKGERIHYFMEIIKQANIAMPDVLIDTVFSIPWGTATRLRGIENFIFDTVDDPDFVQALLEFSYEYTRMVIDALVEAGTGMLTLGAPTAGCSVISPTMFRELARPSFDKMFSYVRSSTQTPLCLHICGYTDPIMEDLLSLPIDWFEIDALSSLERMVSLSQDKVVIRGQMPVEIFIEGTKEQIYEEVKRCVDTAASTNALMLAPGCSVPYNARLENIRFFLDAAHKYGSYDYINQ